MALRKILILKSPRGGRLEGTHEPLSNANRAAAPKIRHSLPRPCGIGRAAPAAKKQGRSRGKFPIELPSARRDKAGSPRHSTFETQYLWLPARPSRPS
jgi:hypothetical protein